MWSVPKCVRFLVLCILHNQCPDTLPAPDYPDICVLLLFLTPFNFCCCCYVCCCCYLIGRRVALQNYITKWIGCHCCCLVAHSCPSLCDPRNCRPPVSSLSPLLSWDFPARSLEWVVASSFSGSSQLRDWTMTPGLLHCRQILYHWGTKEAQISCMYTHIWASHMVW